MGVKLVGAAIIVLVACGPAAAPPAKPSASGPAQPAAAAPAPASAAQPAASAPAAPQPTPVPDKVKITNPSMGMGSLPLFAARDRGFFERNGIEAETMLLSSDRAMAAVASGEIHYVAGVGSASVAAAGLGLPIRAAWFSAASPGHTVFARPDIRTIEQVRGKRVGVPGLGGTSAVVTALALKHYGLDPGSDVTVLAIGTDELLLESLRNGAIELAPLTAPTSLRARAEGFTPLVAIADVVQMPLGGLSISVDKLTHEREQARRVVRALTQAKQWLLENREDGVQMIMETLGADRATAEGTYDETMPTYRGHGLVTREGIENILEILRDAGRLGPEVRFEDVAHAQLAEEVARELGLVQ